MGLDFVHFNGMVGELYTPETIGSGAALFDYDNDGDLDVYLVQGSMLEGEGAFDRALFPPDRQPVRDRLFRNDLEQDAERPTLSFTDVTEQSGLDARGYGMGVAVGDVDNDGWLDIYLTNHGSNQLWRNRGRGGDGEVTFEEVTAVAGADDPRWSTGAAFFDFDRDGWLDLYVVNYVDSRLENHKPCFAPSSMRDYCGPEAFEPYHDRLLRNTTGDGPGGVVFEDVTVRAGLATAAKPGLGVVAADFDSDGWLDVYVANDGTSNLLWKNRHDGTFEEVGLVSGSALNTRGQAEAGMGVDVADFDEDGDPDIFVTHLRRETNTLYVNDGGGNFEDATPRSGLRPSSLPFTSFGTGWLDFDSDGRLDLLVVNGAVNVIPELVRVGDPHPLAEPNQLFRNLGGGRFEDVTPRAGAAFHLPEVSRGAAFGDVDNDGDVDVVVTNNNGPVRLLLNRARPPARWLGFQVFDPELGRDAHGAEVLVRAPGQPARHRRVRNGGSYASASDLRVLAALGPTSGPVTVQVDWPDGTSEEFRPTALDRYSTLRKGEGSLLSASLEPVPWPVLDGMESAVIAQLGEAREALANALEADGEPPEARGARFGELGRLYQSYEFVEAASVCYRNASALDPADRRWPYYLGRLYLELGAAELAGHAFRRSLEVGGEDLPARIGLGQALYDQGRVEDAARQLRRVLEHEPTFAAAHTLLGEWAVARGDLQAAREHFEGALEEQPEATSLHYQLAAVYRGLGDPERAAEHLKRHGEGRVVFPDPLMRDLESLNLSAELLVQAGMDALSAGRLESADARFRRALSILPEDSRARLNLGTVLVRKGLLQEAAEEYRAVLGLEPESAIAHFNLGAVLVQLGEDEAAITHFRRAIEADSGFGDAFFNLANALLRAGSAAEALEHYARARELRPLNSATARGEARALVELGRLAEARERLEAALQAFPDALPIADDLARLLAASPDDSVRDGPRALGLAQRTFEAERTIYHVETLAMAYAEVGDFERAIEWQLRAIAVAEREQRGEVAAELRADLEGYRSGVASRTPWRWWR